MITHIAVAGAAAAAVCALGNVGFHHAMTVTAIHTAEVVGSSVSSDDIVDGHYGAHILQCIPTPGDEARQPCATLRVTTDSASDVYTIKGGFSVYESSDSASGDIYLVVTPTDGSTPAAWDETTGSTTDNRALIESLVPVSGQAA